LAGTRLFLVRLLLEIDRKPIRTKPLLLLRSSHAAVGTTIAAIATITDTILSFCGVIVFVDYFSFLGAKPEWCSPVARYLQLSPLTA
jgi:hypothetical protein